MSKKFKQFLSVGRYGFNLAHIAYYKKIYKRGEDASGEVYSVLVVFAPAIEDVLLEGENALKFIDWISEHHVPRVS